MKSKKNLSILAFIDRYTASSVLTLFLNLVTFVSPLRSKHMVTLAEALSKAELHKNDLDLELQILEEAAELVIEEEQEEKIKKWKQNEGREQTKECAEKDESGSSEEEEEYSSSSSEEEENQEISVPKSLEEQKGAPHGHAVICPCSQETVHGADLIQNLGKRLEEELRIREDVPLITFPFSSALREEEGKAEGLRKTDKSQLTGALDEDNITDAASDTTPFKHRQHYVHILNTEETDSDDEDEPNQ